MKPPTKLETALTAYWANLDSPHSRRGYKHDWGQYEAWLKAEKIPPLRAKPGDVQRYVTSMRDASLAKPTRGRALSVIRSVYDSLVVDGFLPFNPARSVKNIKMSSAPSTPWLDADELRKLLLAIEPDKGGTFEQRRDRLVVLLFVGTGRRRTEVARMKVEDFADGELTGIVKGNKVLTNLVPGWLNGKEIEAWCSFAGITSGTLLPQELGSKKSLSGDHVYQIVKRAAERAGFEKGAVTPHGLRRSLATIAGERGVSLKDLQTALGHASSATTERYRKDVGKSAPGDVLEDLVYSGKTLAESLADKVYGEKKDEDSKK
jgi:integrase/recombinase XerD